MSGENPLIPVDSNIIFSMNMVILRDSLFSDKPTLAQWRHSIPLISGDAHCTYQHIKDWWLVEAHHNNVHVHVGVGEETNDESRSTTYSLLFTDKAAMVRDDIQPYPGWFQCSGHLIWLLPGCSVQPCWFFLLFRDPYTILKQTGKQAAF